MKYLFLTILLATGNHIGTDAYAGDEAGESERRTALYRAPEHSRKCALVFDTLRTKLKEGMNSREVSKALGDSPWLEHTFSYEITVLGGWIPVDLSPERAFAMLVYPNADKWSNYAVYFSLSCPKDFMQDISIDEFLQGKVASRKVLLHQFALCHPGKAPSDNGKIEVLGAASFHDGQADVIEGTIISYVWMSAMQFEDAKEGTEVAGNLDARYYLRIKAPNIDNKNGNYLTFCARGAKIRHSVLLDALKKDEIIVAVPSEHLNELKVGSTVRIVEYEISRDETGCDPTCKTFLIDGKKPTLSGGPFKMAEENADAKKSEQPGAAQPATKPANKAPAKDQPPTTTSEDAPR